MPLTPLLQLDPWAATALVVVLALYGRGVTGLGTPRRHPALRRTHVAACLGGLALWAVSVLGPVEVLAHAFMTAHMVQHLLVVFLVAPMLLHGRLPLVLRAGLPRWAAAAVVTGLGRARAVSQGWWWLPGVGLAGLLLTWWTWHVPALYDLAIRNDGVHVVEHLTLLVAAAAFWSVVVHPRRAPAWAPPLLLFGLTVGSGLLAAVLAFSPPLYEAHPRVWGGLTMDAQVDQQSAAALAWVGGGVVLLAAAVWTFLRWFERAPAGQGVSRRPAARLGPGPDTPSR